MKFFGRMIEEKNMTATVFYEHAHQRPVYDECDSLHEFFDTVQTERQFTTKWRIDCVRDFNEIPYNKNVVILWEHHGEVYIADEQSPSWLTIWKTVEMLKNECDSRLVFTINSCSTSEETDECVTLCINS
jgi:hypothetical protein